MPLELLVQAEVVLEGDRGKRLIFLADADAFLGLDGLVQTVRPAAAGHEAAGERVDDDDLAVLHHVVDVALVEGVGLDARFRRSASDPSFRRRRCCRCRALSSMLTQPSSVTPMVRCFSSTT